MMMLMSAPRSKIAFILFVSSLVPVASPLMLVERMLIVDFVLLKIENGFISGLVVWFFPLSIDEIYQSKENQKK